MNFTEKSIKMNEEEIQNIVFNIRHCTGIILDLIKKKQYDNFDNAIEVMKENMEELEKHLVLYKKLTAKTMPMTLVADLLNLSISEEE